MDIDSRWKARRRRLEHLLNALAKIKEYQPGLVTRRIRVALAKMLPPEMTEDPAIDDLLKGIGLSPKMLESQHQARDASGLRDPFEAGFTGDPYASEMDALKELATLAEYTTPTLEDIARTLEGGSKGSGRVVSQMLEQQASQASQVAKTGAAARHAHDKENREKVLKHWLTGKWSTKRRCAEEVCGDAGISQRTAEKALWGASDPDPWPVKPQHKKRN